MQHRHPSTAVSKTWPTRETQHRQSSSAHHQQLHSGHHLQHHQSSTCASRPHLPRGKQHHHSNSVPLLQQPRRGHHLQHRQSLTYASQPRPPTGPHPASPLHYPHYQPQLHPSVRRTNYRPQRKWNADISTVTMDSTVQSGPVTALARDTEFSTPNCIDSALGASYLATCSAPL